MSAATHGPVAATVLVICADRNFQRFAQTVLRQKDYAAFAVGVGMPDVAVQIRLRSPDVILLDLDSEPASQLRRTLRRRSVVEVSATAAGAESGVIGKWDGADDLVGAVERALSVARRRSGLRLVAS